MSISRISEYNNDLLTTLSAAQNGLALFSPADLGSLRRATEPYLRFRVELEAFQSECFGPFCRRVCFETGDSLCCGFESIFVFFSDLAVNLLVSEPEEVARIEEALGRPNLSQRCVFLGPGGCLWRIPPVSCAMFLCDKIKENLLDQNRVRLDLWEGFRKREKDFTYPDKPVLFDALEGEFIARGVDCPNMFFHKSPGLLRIKARAGAAARKTGEGNLPG